MRARRGDSSSGTLLHPNIDAFKFPAESQVSVQVSERVFGLLPRLSAFETGVYSDCSRFWDMKVQRNAAHTGLRTKSLGQRSLERPEQRRTAALTCGCRSLLFP